MLTFKKTNFARFLWPLIALAFAALMPLDGDEVFYMSWGLAPRLATIDHPPLIGWVHGLNPFLHFFPTTLGLRLPWFVILLGLAWTAERSSPKGSRAQAWALSWSWLAVAIPFMRPDHLVAGALIFEGFAAQTLGWFAKMPSLALAPGMLWSKVWVKKEPWLRAVLPVVIAVAGWVLIDSTLGFEQIRFALQTRWHGQTQISALGLRSALGLFALFAWPLVFRKWSRAKFKTALRDPFFAGAFSYFVFMCAVALVSAKFQINWVLPVLLWVPLICVRIKSASELRLQLKIQLGLIVVLFAGVLIFQSPPIQARVIAKAGRDAYRMVIFNSPRAFTQRLRGLGEHWVSEGHTEATLLRVFGLRQTVSYPGGYAHFKEIQRESEPPQGEFFYLPLSPEPPAPVRALCPKIRSEPVDLEGVVIPVWHCPG